MQTASHLVAGILAAELTAGVQHGIYDCDGRDAGRAGRTDIHAGALAHSLQALQDLDLRTAVGMVCGRFAVGFGDDFFCHEMIASCCGGYLLLLPSMEAVLF